MNHARIRICGPWASRCRLLSIFSLVCKTKIGLPASRESCEHQKPGDPTHHLAVCAWCIVMHGPEDGVQVMTMPSCSHPGSCCKVESGISSIFIALIFFFLLYSFRSLNGIRNNSSFWLHFCPSMPQCLSSLISQTL